MKNQGIKIISMGCRLNTLESEKIRDMLYRGGIMRAVIINSCAVTNEALRQSRQQFHKAIRENPDVPVFITGCGATLCPDDFIGANVRVIPNKDKFDPSAYGLENASDAAPVARFEKMQKKGFVQISDGCDRRCTYCIVSKLRGKAAHFPYERVFIAARALIENGYEEIILTGVNIADWTDGRGNGLAHLCARLLRDLPDMKRLSLSSLDPAADIESLIGLMQTDARMASHLHLSVQSGCDRILAKMGRRHNAARIKGIMEAAKGVTFSWDIICGFPGETEAEFNETLELARQLKPLKIHAFPFSARPGTPAAAMPGRVARAIAKQRVKKLADSR
ncbi:MAG: radical SAM protein [Rickettsiales bacterium]|jgi:threonylcarbamoyladenosine tRNA methylthiotransferase MtaB|nr:radical SAM protein [Rickettsiales bacterium]